MDYVNRDMKNSGINNGLVEYDRLIASAKFTCIEEKFIITYDLKTINTIEDFFFKRWYLYKNIIYHHRVIKTDMLLEYSLEDIIGKYLSSTEDNDKINDTDKKILLPNDISGLWKAIEMAHSHTEFFDSLIQWDDNWLLTVLKTHYFSEYYNTESPTFYKLEELLSNRKNYYPLIKSNFDFQYFVTSFENHLKDQNVCKTIGYKQISEKLPANYRNRKMYLIFAYLGTYLEFGEKEICKNIEDFIEKKHSGNIKDHFVVFKNAKTGLSSEPLVHSADGTNFELSKLSNIKSILETEKSNFPYFYVYINFNNNYSLPQNFKMDFLKELGKYIAIKVNELLEAITL